MRPCYLATSMSFCGGSDAARLLVKKDTELKSSPFVNCEDIDVSCLSTEESPTLSPRRYDDVIGLLPVLAVGEGFVSRSFGGKWAYEVEALRSVIPKAKELMQLFHVSARDSMFL